MTLIFSLSMLTVVTGTPSALSRGRMMPPEKRTSAGLSRSSTGTVSASASFAPAADGRPAFSVTVVGLIEAQAAEAEALVDGADDDAGLGIDREIVFVMRLAADIEALGEGEAGFGLRLGRVDVEPREGEFAARHAEFRMRRTRDGLKTAGDAREEAAASAFALTEEIKTAKNDDEDSQKGAPDQENPPNHFPLPDARRALPKTA